MIPSILFVSFHFFYLSLIPSILFVYGSIYSICLWFNLLYLSILPSFLFVYGSIYSICLWFHLYYLSMVPSIPFVYFWMVIFHFCKDWLKATVLSSAWINWTRVQEGIKHMTKKYFWNNLFLVGRGRGHYNMKLWTVGRGGGGGGYLWINWRVPNIGALVG